MITQSRKKKNKTKPERKNFYMRLITPVLGSEKISPVKRLVQNVLFTYCYKDITPELTFAELSKRYGISVSSCARAIKYATENNFTRGNRISQYELKEELPKDLRPRYFIVENWLYFISFNGSYLTYSEVEILSHLQDLDQSRIKTTQSQIAETLQISMGTVSACLKRLTESYSLLTPIKSKGDHYRTYYKVNRSMLERKKREIVTLRSECLNEAKGDEASARRLFYERLNRDRENRRDKIFRDVKNKYGAEFTDLWSEFSRTDIEAAKADCRHDHTKLNEILQRRAQIRSALKEMLKTLGYSIEDLTERYLCNKCEDTGYDKKTGVPCDCFAPPDRHARHSV